MKLLLAVTGYILCLFSFRGVHGLVLEDITVPSLILIDDDKTDPVFIDCKYEIQEESPYLVVKWIKNNETVYHWIRGQKPEIYPKFRNDIDDTYEASTDLNKQYSGLAITNPTIDSSGLYKCVVQTAAATKSLEKQMQVVDISNYTLNLYHNKMHNETHLECVVEQVYPEPTMSLSTGDDDEIVIISFNVNRDEDGLYNGTVIAVVDDDEDPEEEYRCRVTFKDLNVNLTKIVYSASAVNYASIMLVIFCLAFRINY